MGGPQSDGCGGNLWNVLGAADQSTAKPLTGIALLILGEVVVSLLLRPKALVSWANFCRLVEEWVGIVMFYAIVAFLIPVPPCVCV